MKPADQLAQFVQQGLRAGHSSQELRDGLSAAGWTEREIDDALSGWTQTGLRLPVPRPRPYVSAREAMLYGLMFLTLLALTWHLVRIGFALVDMWLPGTPHGPRGPLIPLWSVATMIVVGPLFLGLYQHTEQNEARDPGQRRSLIRKWFGALALLLSVLVLLGAAISVVYGALADLINVTTLAKTGVVVTVALLVLVSFRGFWSED
ncbi:MAG: hypothetical protein EA407_11230 [Rhodobacteraceae bacterium]|nr:MAG: hypothetical protein EA407_11230 [Paracoccaceae bacterium]